MNRLKTTLAAVLVLAPLMSCASYSAYTKARGAEKEKAWDTAVQQYEKALDVDPQNMKYRIALQRAKLEASRQHFEKGKSLYAAAETSTGADRVRLAQLAATEMELTVKLDSTNQYAAVELGKAVRMAQETQATLSNDKTTIEQMKERAKLTKAQPPQLNPASDEPITLTFPHDTPVKDIYRALANAYGINILFDQAVKDDRISIELRDVTAQQALERVMQAANHFYKVLDEKTIIVVPDNPQARRDYEDLVIRTFYLSNGNAEEVTNVVRTMIEARNVFPLKALNAITIRDTADKVRIAEKIIEANDKAKAEVVVDVELLQMDLDRSRELGLAIAGASGAITGNVTQTTGETSKLVPITGTGTTTTLDQLRSLTSGSYTFSVPSATYALIKSVSNSELLANPELRISEGEKATLHIGQRIPVPVSTFPAVATGTGSTLATNVTSYQYQDVGIKVSMEPRVHHNREVTLKLTVEVSNLGNPVSGGAGQPDQPTFSTRTIESTIRLKDGETNFLAGLIQQTDSNGDTQTPFLSDIPFLGRLFTKSSKRTIRTDLVMTMTPHIIRVPDITEDDLAPMWVGTQNNLTFRGVSPRVESQTSGDPFTARPPIDQFSGANTPVTDPVMNRQPRPMLTNPASGNAPSDPFRNPNPGNNPPQTPPQPPPQSQESGAAAMSLPSAAPSEAALRLSPRIGPQPANLAIKPGEEKLWNVVGMDLDGLATDEIQLHFNPSSINVAEVSFGTALIVDPKTPPVVTINNDKGTVRVASSNGQPLTFASGGDVITLRVRGGMTGETFLVLDNPEFHNISGVAVMSAVSGGRAKVE